MFYRKKMKLFIFLVVITWLWYIIYKHGAFIARSSATERVGEPSWGRDAAGVDPSDGAGGPHGAARRAHHGVHAGLLLAPAAPRRASRFHCTPGVHTGLYLRYI